MDNENGYKNNNYEKLKCIWMASQVIEYKLCDHQFDCENCLFDKVMRNLLHEKETESTGKTNVANIISNKLRSIKYDNKIIYLKNNLVAKEICHNTFYLGINPILICFLDTVSSIMVSEYGKNIFTGQQIIQIIGAWGAFSLFAPMNFLIHDKIGDPTDNTLKSQWFAIIGGVQQEISSGQLYQEEWNKMHERAISTIEEIKLHVPKVGETMLDGGTQIKFLHQLVGNKRYINILNSLSA
jgi:hypothetical protein